MWSIYWAIGSQSRHERAEHACWSIPFKGRHVWVAFGMQPEEAGFVDAFWHLLLLHVTHVVVGLGQPYHVLKDKGQCSIIISIRHWLILVIYYVMFTCIRPPDDKIHWTTDSTDHPSLMPRSWLSGTSLLLLQKNLSPEFLLTASLWSDAMFLDPFWLPNRLGLKHVGSQYCISILLLWIILAFLFTRWCFRIFPSLMSISFCNVPEITIFPSTGGRTTWSLATRTVSRCAACSVSPAPPAAVCSYAAVMPGPGGFQPSIEPMTG